MKDGEHDDALLAIVAEELNMEEKNMNLSSSSSSFAEVRDLTSVETSRYSRSAGSIGLHGVASPSAQQQHGASLHFPKVKRNSRGGSRFEDSLTRPKTTGPFFAPAAGTGRKRARRAPSSSSSSQFGSRSRSRSQKRLQGVPPDVPTDSPSAWESDRGNESETETVGSVERGGPRHGEAKAAEGRAKSRGKGGSRTYPLRLLSTSYDFEGAFQDVGEDGPRSDAKLELVQTTPIGSPCLEMDFSLWEATEEVGFDWSKTSL